MNALQRNRLKNKSKVKGIMIQSAVEIVRITLNQVTMITLMFLLTILIGVPKCVLTLNKNKPKQ